MQTLEFNLTAETWVEILGGNNALDLQVRTANKIRLHFNDSATAPADDAPYVLVDSFPPHWDFSAVTQTGQSHIWAKADATPAVIVVVRRTAEAGNLSMNGGGP